MPVHPDIFSEEALRHVRQGSSRPPGQLSADELPPMAASWASTERLPVGTWKEQRPRYARGLSPCLAHCPVGNDVEGFVSRVRDGDVETAATLLAAESPFPSVCGRVCYHPCEVGCSRVSQDGAVNIRAIELYLGDLPFFASPSVWTPARPSSGKRVAVVGAGPGGLAGAWGLALLGHAVEILERAPEPGGLLRYGIPSYRLPKEVLSREIDRLRELGVRLSCGGEVGAVRELSGLLDRFDAVFVAAGAVRSRSLGLGDGDPEGSFSALEFLSRIAAGKSPELGQECVVVGGGNSAVDAARSARRLGASVTILYRRSRAEMPAFEAEIDDALAEGVQLRELAIPLELLVENGRLTGVKCLRTRPGEADESGRRAPVPIPESEFLLRASSLINALGEQVDRQALTPSEDFQRALTELDPWGSSGIEGLFAAGDFAGSERTVAHALGGGKRAAMAIDRYLMGKADDPLDRYRVGGGPASLAAYLAGVASEVLAEGIQVVPWEHLNPAYFPHAERHELSRRIDAKPRNDFGEVEEGFTGQQAREEAGRCYSCGRCTRCGLCQIGIRTRRS
jgi:formate dehydrogenase major subunit